MKLHRYGVQLVGEDEKIVAEIAADVEEFIAHHRHAPLLKQATVTASPFVEGGASDPGVPFDRQAARASGVTVDVTQPGGVG